MQPRKNSDHGFTMVELLFAAAIFLFAFSAVMSLVLASQDAAGRAKEKAITVNAAASYIERVRRLPYDQVGLVGGDPAGTLTNTTVVVGNTTMVIVPTVTWVDDPAIAGAENYKRLRVTATSTQSATDPRPFVYVTETMIKVADYYVAPNPPDVFFGAGSPTDGAVIWGSSVTVSIDASSNGIGTTLSSMSIYYGSLPMANSFGTAQWAVSTGSEHRLFNWDTTSVDASGNALVPDGIYTIKAEAWDSNGQQGAQTRTITVDNSPPGTPATITATAAGPTTMNVAWSLVFKGNSPTDHYGLTVQPQPATATDTGSTSAWIPATTTNFSTNAAAWTVSPLSRYLFSVAAYGPAPNNRTSGLTTQTIGVSPPKMTGSYTNTKSGSNYTLATTINVAGPTFPVTGVVSWTINRSANVNMSSPDKTWTLTGSSISNWTEPSADRVSAKGGSPNRYYQVKVVVTPAGYGGGTALTLYSQIVGPLGGSGSGTF
jgi:type II secretory pathway pseudopilin PulG